MIPFFSGERLDWAPAIGLFSTNFGQLDLAVQNFLETNLSPEEFVQFKDRHFSDRIERIREHVQQPGFSVEKGDEFEKLVLRLEPIREIRNQIAHGLMRMGLAEDLKTWTITLSLSRDADGTNSPEARHLTFTELLKASTDIADLTDDFKKWDGDWVTDADIIRASVSIFPADSASRGKVATQWLLRLRRRWWQLPPC